MMSDEDKNELRALLREVVREEVIAAVGSAVGGLQKHLDDRFVELGADVEQAIDKLDDMEISVHDTRLAIDRIFDEQIEVKRHVAKLSREQFRELRRDESKAKRLDELERRMAIVEVAAKQPDPGARG